MSDPLTPNEAAKVWGLAEWQREAFRLAAEMEWLRERVDLVRGYCEIAPSELTAGGEFGQGIVGIVCRRVLRLLDAPVEELKARAALAQEEDPDGD